MPELFTRQELEQHFREEVSEAGGAKKWLRKHRLTSLAYVEHMISDGRGATLEEVLRALGFRRVERFEPISQQKP